MSRVIRRPLRSVHDLPPLPPLSEVCAGLGLSQLEVQDRLRAGARLSVLMGPDGSVVVRLLGAPAPTAP